MNREVPYHHVFFGGMLLGAIVLLFMLLVGLIGYKKAEGTREEFWITRQGAEFICLKVSERDSGSPISSVSFGGLSFSPISRVEATQLGCAEKL